MSKECPKCGAPWTSLGGRWSDVYMCGTVYPIDGPSRVSTNCQKMSKSQDGLKELKGLAQKALDAWGARSFNDIKSAMDKLSAFLTSEQDGTTIEGEPKKEGT